MYLSNILRRIRPIIARKVFRVAIWKDLMLILFALINVGIYSLIYVLPTTDIVSVLIVVVIGLEECWYIAVSEFLIIEEVDRTLKANGITEVNHAKNFHPGPWWIWYIASGAPLAKSWVFTVHHGHIHWIFPRFYNYIHVKAFFNRLQLIVLLAYSIFYLFNYIPDNVIWQLLIALPYTLSFVLYYIGDAVTDLFFLYSPNSRMYKAYFEK